MGVIIFFVSTFFSSGLISKRIPIFLFSCVCLFSLFAFYFMGVNVPYRLARVKSFLDPWSDQNHGGFQVIQSLLSFHAGGLKGVGLGQGQSKLMFLPEAHNDFTLAVLGEELGFVGFVF